MLPHFPGMNPYLENPDLWTEVHFGLIGGLARFLNGIITPKYRAAVEKRVYQDALLVGIPDVAIATRRAEPASPSVTHLQTAVPASEPIQVAVPMLEEVTERFLEIREVGTGTVVTVVEVLSPKNKRPGERQTQYDRKRQALLSSSANLVEIDLLRTGEPKPMLGGVPSDYRILVSRADERPAASLYAFNLRDRIPRFPVPLKPSDEEPVVDLEAILNQVYTEAALALAIAYDQPPVPPLREEDQRWLQTLISSEPGSRE